MANSRWIVVDNRDSGIAYEGPWFTVNDSFDNVGNFGPTYLSTLHGTNETARLSYEFDGSEIKLLGTNRPRNSSGVIDPTWDCLIDGVSIGPTRPFEFAENNWVFCDWRNGLPGRHTLEVQVRSEGQTFWVDQIQYLPSPGAEVEKPAVMVGIQDHAIKYGKGWTTLGGTANMTRERGSVVEVEFIGTRLSWWGFIPTELPHDSTSGAFAIDGEEPTNFPLRGLPEESATIYNQMFFQTAELLPGPHKLFVMYRGSSSTTPLTLTHLLIHDGNFTAPGPDEPSIFDTANTPEPSLPPSALPDTGNKTPVGAIVGGTLGGLFLLALTAFIVVFLRRRKKRSEAGPFMDTTGPTPYDVTGTGYVSGGPSSPSFDPHLMYNPVPVAGGPGHRSMPSQSTDQTYDHPTIAGSPPAMPHHPPTFTKAQLAYGISNPDPSVSSGQSRTHQTSASDGNTNGSTGVGSRVIRHEDSGVRLNSPEDVVEIPPMYTPS
ncbi:hypothetical protein CC1G_13844 [Coprinopsis cinerea okayama7|uniref:Uncharacterized protein n=1 Tax=Coprinopsis cinerea (strain Okayama-7 / 130 / ATCC MYA-4618 / FGSC 9003) TaxID=240176 RepID=D6RKK6_COPC7|nr:hypothetical protein CC1G_13844 [Coprinopsis cinerea okayama7\|eukprot:XP_002911809.1 hypothetical protein CC1G_13844 [Coprinopsis cinerea okayama7\